jgi:hypothetical protein
MKKSQEQLTRINAPNGLARNFGYKSRLMNSQKVVTPVKTGVQVLCT